MAIDDLYEATTYVRTAEGTMQFTFGYKMEAGTINAETLTKASLEFGQNRLDAYAAAVSVDVEVDKVEFRAVTNTDDIPGFVNFNNLEGAIVGDALPNSCAVVLGLLTNAPNAKHNGRMYLPGLAEGDQSKGDVSALAQTRMNTFGTKLELDLIVPLGETAEFTPVVISRFIDGAKRTPPIGFSLVSATARSTMKQQRRRGGKRFGLSG